MSQWPESSLHHARLKRFSLCNLTKQQMSGNWVCKYTERGSKRQRRMCVTKKPQIPIDLDGNQKRVSSHQTKGSIWNYGPKPERLVPVMRRSTVLAASGGAGRGSPGADAARWGTARAATVRPANEGRNSFNSP